MNKKKIRHKLIILLFLIFNVVLCYTQDIAVNNISSYKSGVWNWTIYLEAPQHIIQEIQYVDYVLYLSTSRPTTIRVSERDNTRYNWAYSGQSKGFFKIEARVRFRTGQLRIINHTLVLNSPEISQRFNIQADNIATRIREDWWSWTVYITADENVLSQIQCVEYTLHPTFQDPVKLVCERGTGAQAFPLKAFGWGTFTIDILIFFKDGEVQELSHYLHF